MTTARWMLCLLILNMLILPVDARAEHAALNDVLRTVERDRAVVLEAAAASFCDSLAPTSSHDAQIIDSLGATRKEALENIVFMPLLYVQLVEDTYTHILTLVPQTNWEVYGVHALTQDVLFSFRISLDDEQKQSIDLQNNLRSDIKTRLHHTMQGETIAILLTHNGNAYYLSDQAELLHISPHYARNFTG